MKTKNVFFLYFFLISTGLTAYSQSIKGRITDAKNGNPIPFVSLAIEGTTSGTVSDFEGNFFFEVPKKYAKKTLVAACIGYKEKKIRLSEILGEQDIQIQLRGTNVKIEEVRVERKSLQAYAIARKAVEKISENYISTPYNYELKYQNTDNIRGENPLIRKSTVLLYDSKGYYKSNVYETFKELNYRFLYSERNFVTDNWFLGTTHMDEILEFDVVRHSNNALNKKNIRHFEFAIKEKTTYKGDSVWVLSYHSKKADLANTGLFFAHSCVGELYVKMQDYAVLYNSLYIESGGYSGLTNNLYATETSLTPGIKKVTYSIETTYGHDGKSYLLDKIICNMQLTYEKEEKKQLTNRMTLLEVISSERYNPKVLTARNYFDRAEKKDDL